MTQVTLSDIMNDENVLNTYVEIKPKFDLLLNDLSKEYSFFDLPKAMLLKIMTIADAAANHICSDDYLAARKLINDILDMLGGQTDGKEGGAQ